MAGFQQIDQLKGLKLNWIVRLGAKLAAIALSSLSLQAFGQAFPSKPISVIVPFGAGSGTDVACRLFTKAASDELKGPIVIENRAGAAGTVAAVSVARSTPDGYTLLCLGGGSLSKTFRREMPVDLLTDLVPIIQLSKGSMSLIVKADLPVKNLQDFIALVHRNPGKFNYAWIASTQMMPMEVLKDRAKIDIIGVPYKALSNVIQAFESGDVIALVSNETGLESLFAQHKVRFLTYLDSQRSPYMPEVPTSTEAGIPDVKGPFTQGIWAPAKTPSDVVARLNAGFNRALSHPEIKDFAQRQKAILVGGEPKVQSESVRAEQAYWEQAAKLANFQPE